MERLFFSRFKNKQQANALITLRDWLKLHLFRIKIKIFIKIYKIDLEFKIKSFYQIQIKTKKNFKIQKNYIQNLILIYY